MLASLGRKTIGVETRRVLRKNCRELRHSYAALRDGYVLMTAGKRSPDCQFREPFYNREIAR